MLRMTGISVTSKPLIREVRPRASAALFFRPSVEKGVVQSDTAVGKSLTAHELESHVRLAPAEERNPLADQNGDDVHLDFVEFSGVHEGRGYFAASHHPDVLALLGAQAAR